MNAPTITTDQANRIASLSLAQRLPAETVKEVFTTVAAMDLPEGSSYWVEFHKLLKLHAL